MQQSSNREQRAKRDESAQFEHCTSNRNCTGFECGATNRLQRGAAAASAAVPSEPINTNDAGRRTARSRSAP